MHCSQYVLALDSGSWSRATLCADDAKLIAAIVLPAAENGHITLDTRFFCFADAVIVNYNLGIRDIFQEHGNGKDILFSKDYGGNSIVNAGDSFV